MLPIKMKKDNKVFAYLIYITYLLTSYLLILPCDIGFPVEMRDNK